MITAARRRPVIRSVSGWAWRGTSRCFRSWSATPAAGHHGDPKRPERPQDHRGRVGGARRRPELLELMHASEADSKATGPGCGAIGRLPARGSGAPLPDGDGGRGAATGRSDAPHDPAFGGRQGVHVEIAAGRRGAPARRHGRPDERGLVSKAAAVLALNSLGVDSALVNIDEGIAITDFVVSPPSVRRRRPTCCAASSRADRDVDVLGTWRSATRGHQFGDRAGRRGAGGVPVRGPRAARISGSTTTRGVSRTWKSVPWTGRACCAAHPGAGRGGGMVWAKSRPSGRPPPRFCAVAPRGFRRTECAVGQHCWSCWAPRSRRATSRAATRPRLRRSHVIGAAADRCDHCRARMRLGSVVRMISTTNGASSMKGRTSRPCSGGREPARAHADGEERGEYTGAERNVTGQAATQLLGCGIVEVSGTPKYALRPSVPWAARHEPRAATRSPGQDGCQVRHQHGRRDLSRRQELSIRCGVLKSRSPRAVGRMVPPFEGRSDGPLPRIQAAGVELPQGVDASLS